MPKMHPCLEMPPICWWSNKKIANFLGVQPATVRKWKNGRSPGSNSSKILFKIVEEFGFEKADRNLMKKINAVHKIVEALDTLDIEKGSGE
jgi:transcriptional regulator with XRE-family HTH domain